MEDAKIIEFVKANIEPLHDYPDKSPLYRCSAHLKDGIYLPCVIVRSKKAYTKLALRRFQECHNAIPKGFKKLYRKAPSKNSFLNYESIVSHFIASGSNIDSYRIDHIDISPYAIPPERMNEIVGETSMNWTGFTVQMRDDKVFKFGTSYITEFFDMPDGYTANDIKKIIPVERGTPRNFDEKVFREKPYFDCYIEGI